jgi:MFS family permease
MRPRLWTRDFILVCLVTFTAFSSFHLFLPTLPIYVQVLGGGSLEVGLVNALFAFSAIIFRPFVGRQLDSRGRIRILIAGVAVFLLATVIYNFVHQVWSLLLLRLLHGAGWAATTTAGHALVADIAPEVRRGEGMGFFGISANLGIAIGPLLGLSLIGDEPPFNFRLMFIVAAVLATSCLILALRMAEPERERPTREDVRPSFLGPFLFPAATMMVLTYSFGTLVTFIPLYAQAKAVQNIGLFFTAYAITLMFTRPLAGTLSDTKGRAVVILPGIVLASLATASLILWSSLPSFLFAAVLFGIGFGGTHPCIMAFIVDVVPGHMKGAAMGFFTAAFDLGIGLGSLLSGLVLQLSGFNLMFASAAGLTLTGLATFSFAQRKSRLDVEVRGNPFSGENPSVGGPL